MPCDWTPVARVGRRKLYTLYYCSQCVQQGSTTIIYLWRAALRIREICAGITGKYCGHLRIDSRRRCRDIFCGRENRRDGLRGRSSPKVWKKSRGNARLEADRVQIGPQRFCFWWSSRLRSLCGRNGTMWRAFGGNKRPNLLQNLFKRLKTIKNVCNLCDLKQQLRFFPHLAWLFVRILSAGRINFDRGPRFGDAWTVL